MKLAPLESNDGVVRWENPDASVSGPRPEEGLFPHLYFSGSTQHDSGRPGSQGRKLWLTKDEVESVRDVVVEAGAAGGWRKALDSLQDWLV